VGTILVGAAGRAGLVLAAGLDEATPAPLPLGLSPELQPVKPKLADAQIKKSAKAGQNLFRGA